MPEKTKQTQVLFFRWGTKEFGIEIKDIQEVVTFENTLPVPLAPPFLNRVTNIRGKIVTIFYLNQLLKIENMEEGAAPRVLVLRNKDLQAGIYVDTVSDIHFIDKSCMGPVPESLSKKNSGKFFKGEIEMKTKEKRIPLFDSEAIAKFLTTIEF